MSTLPRPTAAFKFTGYSLCHTIPMVCRVAVTLDRKAVADLDRMVEEGRFPNRSRAIRSAVDLLAERESRTRLARELGKLNPQEEKRLAEEGLTDAWPEDLLLTRAKRSPARLAV